MMRPFSIALLLIILAVLLFAPELLANKFETMSSGVAGVTWQKVRVLKVIGLVFGLFAVISGLLIMIFRHRISRGMHVSYWWQGVPYYVPIIFIIFGLSIALPYFL